ncbi:MAG: four helix bundle protein [Gemmataceae bacterium]|nr:four helix bundle protein [Gemmataceae bacterium]
MDVPRERRRKGDDIAARLLAFAVRVIKLTECLPRSVAGRHISNQLMRAATSVGANYEEARGGESRADFVHKVGVAWKETREATYWLRVIREAALVNPARLADLLHEGEELSAILGASSKTAKQIGA